MLFVNHNASYWKKTRLGLVSKDQEDDLVSLLNPGWYRLLESTELIVLNSLWYYEVGTGVANQGPY